jgi:UDP-3-O-[3-hydroxymyristoyl] glucosamine N-acyltransferase
MKLSEIANAIQGEVFVPNGYGAEIDPDIRQIDPISEARPESLSFLGHPDYEKYLATSKATAIILRTKKEDLNKLQIVHANPYLAFARISALVHLKSIVHTGVSPLAVVDPSVELPRNITIMPFATVAKGVKLGEGVIIQTGSVIGENTVIGERTQVYANVTIYHDTVIGKDCVIHSGAVIGSDGFGYTADKGEIVKIPQVGRVRIGDCVEIGATTTIDRATLGETRIGDGCKLDSRVQVGHNVVMGKNCMISGLAGIAGSAKLGDRVVMGGHSGINGHIEIGDDVRIGAMSVAVKSIDVPGDYLGFPARPAGEWRRMQVHLKKLNELEKRVKNLEAQEP